MPRPSRTLSGLSGLAVAGALLVVPAGTAFADTVTCTTVEYYSSAEFDMMTGYYDSCGNPKMTGRTSRYWLRDSYERPAPEPQPSWPCELLGSCDIFGYW